MTTSAATGRRSPASRSAPPRRRPFPLAGRAFEYWLYQYKRTWRGSVVSTLLTPTLFLAAMGIGLGSLVNHAHGTVEGVGYLSYLAPGLLAASAMQTAAQESTYPVLAAIKWMRTYLAMLATPLGVTDALVGHLLWIAVRIAAGSCVYLAVMAAFGVVHSPLAALAVPAALLTGLAFAAPVVAFAATRDNDSGFAALFRFGITPMFLFSGVFFPASQLPVVLRQVAYATPLWHGVALCRGLVLGRVQLGGALVHVGYLGLWAGCGLLAAVASYRRRLVV